VGGAVLAAAGAPTAASLIKPGEAEAFHFCGHIYTTDSCPHPTGLPRDRQPQACRCAPRTAARRRSRPLDRRAGPSGRRRTAAPARPDGDPLPSARRTPVCKAVGETYGFPPQLDGAWYRCCGGKVRKLVDCCGYVRNRINGDAALTGYCYKGRKVFCVMYFQTKVSC
jgi:hypothetical protein